MEELRICIEQTPSQTDLDTLEHGLAEHDGECGIEWSDKPLAAFLRDKEDRLIGGLRGITASNWLYIARVWVAKDMRGVGYGRSLMGVVEHEAVSRGCRYAHLETYSYQALGFYLKLGYTVFGTLEDYPGGHTKYFLRKALV